LSPEESVGNARDYPPSYCTENELIPRAVSAQHSNADIRSEGDPNLDKRLANHLHRHALHMAHSELGGSECNNLH
jgi:hypothetical protein